MKKLINKTLYILALMTLTLNNFIVAHADTFDNVMKSISGWVTKIGGAIAFVGGITFAMALSSEDAGGKRRGIIEFVSGLIVAAFAIGYKTIFGL